MSLTLYNPTVHMVKDTPVARYFRRVLNFPDILTFWSLDTGQWILGYWLDPLHRAIEEIEDLGHNFEAVTPQFSKMITDCWTKVNFKKHRKRLAGQVRDKLRRREEELIEQNKKWNWAKKQTGDRAVVPYAFQLPCPTER